MKFLNRSNGKHPDGAAAEIPPVIDIREITKSYQMGAEELKVLKGISLRIERGEFVSIMGPSGSGKSTLMNILGALDQPTSGQYVLDGEDISRLSQAALARIRNQKIGFVFQNFNLLKRTTTLRQVELPLIYAGASNRGGRAKAALDSVGLSDRLKHLPSELSGGQQQRVAIARALVTEPSIILADEPTGNLDSHSGAEVMQIFQRLNRDNGITTVFVTHDPWIARHTNRVIMIRDGMVVADQRVAKPLVAGVDERPSEAEELAGIFQAAYYGSASASESVSVADHAVGEALVAASAGLETIVAVNGAGKGTEKSAAS
ncbi:MAG: ABC transporter ATP-binding protein [Chloroflexi bacterium]|nr:ABC transporter ATP-binding protein [Chloroflexota bacterium]